VHSDRAQDGFGTHGTPYSVRRTGLAEGLIVHRTEKVG
jgi:hypothetical protein